MIGAWPLVGRREELALVGDLSHGRPGGRPSGIVVAGAAGVGKTRFAAEAVRAAEADRCVTFWATATKAAASIPFGALAHLLPVPAAGAADRLDLLQRAGQALSEQAAGRRLVLVIDDAHLLDEASAALLHQLAATSMAFLIITVRSGEQILDPILALWKDGLSEHLELQPHTQQEVARLVETVLDGDVDGPTLLRVWEATRGNAMFVRELVGQGLEQGTLSDASGIWRWTGSSEPGSRLGELVEARLGQLGDAERDVLELVALGEPLGVSVLEQLAGRESLEEVRRRGLLAAERTGRRLDLRLEHPIYGEVLRPLAVVRRSLLARLADALEAAGGRRREDLLRLAGWRLEAGVSGPPDVFVAAASRAQASFDPALAERLAAAAITAGGGFTARLALAVALVTQARFAESEQVLAELEASVDGDVHRALVADARAGNLFWGLGRADEAERVLIVAEDQLHDGELRDELAAVRSAFLAFLGRPVRALAVARPIVHRCPAAGRAAVRAGLATVTALVLTGGVDEAGALVDRLREPALRHAEQLPFLPNQLLAAYSAVLTLGGRVDDAVAEAGRNYERALADHSHDGTALWAMTLGRALLGRGAVRSARALLQEAAALFAEIDQIGFGSVCLALESQAHALAGEPDRAEQTMKQALAGRRPGFRLFDAELGLARAWSAAARGELSAARAHAVRVARQADANGQLAYAALALHDLTRLGDPAGASERLDELADALDGPLPPVYARHAAALAAGDAAALDDSAAAFQAIGSRLLAAECYAEAAAAHRERGELLSAGRSAGNATRLAEQCERPRTPALARAGDAAILTRREHEVAALAASGLSNRAIADRLVLSVRTVEHHLQHAYRKLGVTDRSELDRILHPLDTGPALPAQRRHRA